MARRLNSYVHVDDRVFGPDDDVPAEYAARIGDHAWEDDGSRAPAPVVVDLPADDVRPAPAGSSVKVPPRAGPKSGRDVWVAYAEANGVEVTDRMRSRDDVVAAVEKAGIPVE